jgi:hypothetical protein
MSEISKMIEYEKKKWIESSRIEVESAKDINNGYCSEFAKSVKDTMGRPDDLRILSYGYEMSGYNSGAHKWIFYQGKHYDVECSSGVDEPEDLQIFRRNNIKPNINTS